MRTCIANATVTAIAGSIIDVSEKEAAELIKGGYAEAIKEKAEVAAKPAAKTGKPQVADKADETDDKKGK
jgi:hypothetical protein